MMRDIMTKLWNNPNYFMDRVKEMKRGPVKKTILVP